MDETALHFIIRLKFSSDFYKLLLNRGADLKICDAVSDAFLIIIISISHVIFYS